MTTPSVSPGAALLRASRMFSMPAPIPAAPGDFSSATKRHSPTATIPYPTHLSVTTPSSSRIIGDWGFKRPFPLKTTTKTTIPIVRVRQVDSIEHVTDFQSASDHSLTLMKFQELHLPITAPAPAQGSSAYNNRFPRSVFEEDSDMTAIPEGREDELMHKRWRFKGPWLAGMTDGEFERYLERQVRGRRTEFRAFLKERLASEITSDQARVAKEEAVPAPEPVSAADVTEQQLAAYIKRLRHDLIELYQLVGIFLDLAPLAKTIMPSDMVPNKEYMLYPPSVYSMNGPPITHPSAGLSYLRTRQFQDNHPLYGPQLKHPPVEARVVMPRSVATGNFNPSIGVAGFIVKTDQESSFNRVRMGGNRQKDWELANMDLETPGGAKRFTDVKDVHVNPAGRVIMRVSDADPNAEVVQKEMLGRADAYEAALRKAAEPEVHRNPNSGKNPYRKSNPRLGNSRNYGFETRDYSRNL